ncbi:MAG: NADH-quinone oxidoreductase subunit D [Dehalobacter sp. 4CP]|uniref:NADH-quinone oxidoreductase subunit D n=1 Tax=Dehalobacter sp. CP TaxID=2594474 RepID=UPI0013C90503|nr:NADH-quinone oxidoreductase subunit D [Dehalobacter sp.]NBJ14472.1 NADH-quinone oxidoreductase subunit D [Dehalobacter sp. 4CP]
MNDIRTQEMNLNFGPQHPSTHGVYRGVFTMQGEYITKCVNHIGYLHRGIEKLAESRTYTQFIPYNGRLDYVSGILNEEAYVRAVEKLMGISDQVPERAEYIRVMMAELQRIASHLVFYSSMALDMAGFTPWTYGFRERDTILDLFEMATGSRMMPNYMRFGGVAADLNEEFMPALRKLLDIMPKCMEEYHGILTGNEIFQARTKGVAPLSREKALIYGISGPSARASGIDYDLRRDEPYGIYDRFKFNVPVRQTGDTFDRYIVRMEEMAESVKILEQAYREIPEGPVLAKVPKIIKPPAGEVYHRIEHSKGHLGFHIVSDGTAKPYRLRICSPCFVNVAIFEEMAVGLHLQDAVVAFASLDIVLGEIDR